MVKILKLKVVIDVALIFAISVAVVSIGSKEWWISDILANLKLHILLGATVLLVTRIFLGRHWVLLPAAGLIMLTALSEFRLDSEKPSMFTDSDQVVRISSLNLGSFRNDAELTQKFLSASGSDIVVLQEFSNAWDDAVKVALVDFPYELLEARNDSFGIAIFSRVPLRNAAVETFADSYVPYITADIKVAGGDIRIFAVHLPWPLLPSSFAARNRMIGELIDLTKEDGIPALICGDWNLTPWSGWYRRLFDAGFDDGPAVQRFHPTWPSRLGWLGIPIDHCFAGDGVTILDKKVEQRVESDHKPISLEISLISKQ